MAAISIAGNFIVHFEGYGTQEEVDKSNVRQAPSSADAGGSGYKGWSPPLWRVCQSCVFVLPHSTQPTNFHSTFAAAGVAAPKRRKVDEEAAELEMPEWLEIKPTGQLCMHAPSDAARGAMCFACDY